MNAWGGGGNTGHWNEGYEGQFCHFIEHFCLIFFSLNMIYIDNATISDTNL